MADIKEQENPGSVDESILENQSVVDFSDIDEQIANQHKERKTKVKAAVEKQENKKVEEEAKSNQNKDANDKLANALFDKTDEEEVIGEDVHSIPKISKNEALPNKEESEASASIKKTIPEEPKKEVVEKAPSKEEDKNEQLVLEEDEMKKRSKTEMVVEDPEEDDELDELLDTPSPKSAAHRVQIEENEKKESKEEFVIDTDQSEKIIDDTEDPEERKKKEEKLQKEVEERLVKRTGYKVYGGEGGIPCIYASDNPNIKALKEWNIPSEKIKPIANDDESLKKAFLDQYITLANAQDSTVVDHRISRFPLLLSGYYAEMTDYSMAELTSVIRVIRNPEYKFARKFQEELVSLFNHISWTSLKPNGEKLTFEEWLKATKFQDLNMFYFGAYDATYPGIGNYDITCGRCHNAFRISKSNRALSYMLQNNNDPILKDTFIKDVLMEKIPVSELKKTVVYSKANTVFDDKVLRPHNYRIGYSCPSLMDVLEYLSVFDEFLSEEVEDFEAIIDPDADGHNLLSMYTMIKYIVVPVIRGKNEEGKNVVSFIKIDTDVPNDEERMRNRRYIVKVLKDLPQSEFAELFTGKEVAERKRLTGIVHILHNIPCSNCGVTIPRIVIDMRTNFFIRTATVVDQIDQF